MSVDEVRLVLWYREIVYRRHCLISNCNNGALGEETKKRRTHLMAPLFLNRCPLKRGLPTNEQYEVLFMFLQGPPFKWWASILYYPAKRNVYMVITIKGGVQFRKMFTLGPTPMSFWNEAKCKISVSVWSISIFKNGSPLEHPKIGQHQSVSPTHLLLEVGWWNEPLQRGVFTLNACSEKNMHCKW